MSDEINSIDSETNGRMLTVSEDLPKGGPNKTQLGEGGGGAPKKPCVFCGRMHWSNKCFKNPRADIETQKKAARIAPSLPAALTYKGKQEKGKQGEAAAAVAKKLAEINESEDAGGSAALARASPTSNDDAHDDLITQGCAC